MFSWSLILLCNNNLYRNILFLLPSRRFFALCSLLLPSPSKFLVLYFIFFLGCIRKKLVRKMRFLYLSFIFFLACVKDKETKLQGEGSRVAENEKDIEEGLRAFRLEGERRKGIITFDWENVLKAYY